MTTLAIKKELHKAIDGIESEQTLKVIHLIVKEELKRSQEIVKPFTIEEFYARNEQSQKEIEQGKLIAHNFVKERFS